MRVTFQYSKTGREKVMSERDADVLTKLGHGKILGADTSRPTYLTRDMQSAPVTPAPQPVHEPAPTPEEDETEDAPKRRGRPRKVVEE